MNEPVEKVDATVGAKTPMSSSPTIDRVVKENFTNGCQKGETNPSPSSFKFKHPVMTGKK